jgi:hypothetical protein
VYLDSTQSRARIQSKSRPYKFNIKRKIWNQSCNFIKESNLNTLNESTILISYLVLDQSSKFLKIHQPITYRPLVSPCRTCAQNIDIISAQRSEVLRRAISIDGAGLAVMCVSGPCGKVPLQRPRWLNNNNYLNKLELTICLLLFTPLTLQT